MNWTRQHAVSLWLTVCIICAVVLIGASIHYVMTRNYQAQMYIHGYVPSVEGERVNCTYDADISIIPPGSDNIITTKRNLICQAEK